MDLKKTGEFIQQKRKAKKLTQVELAERLNISEKTVSKWECGKGFPDTSLILPLCKELDITANELLSAKTLSNDEYKSKAEENLVLLKSRNEKAVKHLFTIEIVLGILSTSCYLLLLLCAIFAVENLAWKVTIIVLDVVLFLVGIGFAIRIEQVAGFYECSNCHHKYVPSYKSVLFAMHNCRMRYLKCPKCGKRTWNKKVLDDDSCDKK